MALDLKWRDGIAQAVGTINGCRVRKSLGTRCPREAYKRLADEERRIEAEIVHGPTAVRLFEEAAAGYVTDGGDARFLEPIMHFFKGRLVSSITPADIRDAARTIYPTASAATRNRQGVTPARAVVNWAATEKWCAPIRVKGFKVDRPKPRRAVDLDWLTAFRAEARRRGLPHLAALARFMFETGIRVGQAASLTAGQMDLANGTASFPRTKNSEGQTCALSPGMVAELAELNGATSDSAKVFRYAGRSGVNPVWKRVCEGAGIEHVPPHQAGRHSFATALRRAGYEPEQIAAAGNWKSVRLVVETYTHLDAPGRAATNALGASLDQQETHRADATIVTLASSVVKRGRGDAGN